MEIKLNKLEIRNFKGIREYVMELNGDSAHVYGDNATGKTTLYDAFLWCLFGKNSADQSDDKFDWKPLDEQNNEIHRLETQVVATLDIDGKPKEFGRLKAEKWTRKRGSTSDTFDGHVTTYHVDGLKVTQKAYKAELEQLLSEDSFRILTKLNYFPEVMDKAKRRNELLSMVEIEDDQVFVKHPELVAVKSLLDGTTEEIALKKNKQQRAQINQDIQALPGRIDEVDRSLPDLTGLDKELLQGQLQTKEQEASSVREKMAAIKQDATGSIKLEIDSLKLHQRELEQEYKIELHKELEHLFEAKREVEDGIATVQGEHRKLMAKARELVDEMNDKEKRLARQEQETDDLREEFKRVQATTMTEFDTHMLVCPTCQREFDEEKADEIKDRYQSELEKFNQDKANRLANIQQRGKTLKGLNDQLQVDIQTVKEKICRHNDFEITECDSKLEKLQMKQLEIQKRINTETTNQTPFNQTEVYAEVQAKIDKLTAQLSNVQEVAIRQTADLQAQLNAILTEQKDIQAKLYQFTLYDQQNERKQELIEQEEKLALEYSKLEQELFLLEDFAKAKAELLTDEVNRKFKIVKFKLFDTQINGGITEVCEPMVNGKNYSTGLNTAAKINAGLDIVNTLMQHYGVKVPVFVDNAESVNELIDIETQVITLSVSKDKTMKVEVK